MFFIGLYAASKAAPSTTTPYLVLADGLYPCRFSGQLKNPFDRIGRPPRLAVFHCIGFHVPGALKGLIEQAGEVSRFDLRISRDFAEALSDSDNRIKSQWEDKYGQKRQRPVVKH